MKQRAIKSIFLSISVLVVYIHAGGYFLHTHGAATENTKVHTDGSADAQLHAVCELCKAQAAPLFRFDYNPLHTLTLEKRVYVFFPRFKADFYSVSPFAANPKSPPARS